MLTSLFKQLAAAALVLGAGASVWAYLWAGFVAFLAVAALTLFVSAALLVFAALNSFVEHKFAQAS